MLNSAPFRSLPSVAALLIVALCWSTPLQAQDAEPADAAEAPLLTSEEKQAKAIALFKEGQALIKEAKQDEAVAKFEEAFTYFADPNLVFMIGETLQVAGTEARDFEKLQRSVEAYKKYVGLVAEGALTDKANERIGQLEESIAGEEKRKQRIADEDAQDKLDAELEAKKEEEERLRKLRERKEMQIVLDASVLAGADLQLSGVLRMAGGALFSWEKFAFEAHAGIDGMLRVDADQGTSARSITVLDVGMRYGANYRYVGPFVSGGVGFGLFSGKPRERKLKDNTSTCAGYDQAKPGTCSFNIDKNITGRIGFGYGFQAAGKNTVALRIEAQYWLFSIDGDQEIGSPPPFAIEKPQSAIAIMAGLEFMRWL